MNTLVLTVHILLAFVLVGLVLLQQGKGADAGAVIGGGANTLFGVGGASTLLVKLTTGVAIAFMLTSVLLVRLAAVGAGTPQSSDGGSTADALQGSVWEGALAPTTAPAVAAVGTVTVAAETPAPVVTGAATGAGQEVNTVVAAASTVAPVVPAAVTAQGVVANDSSAQGSSGTVVTNLEAGSIVATPIGTPKASEVQPAAKSEGKKPSVGKSGARKSTAAPSKER